MDSLEIPALIEKLNCEIEPVYLSLCGYFSKYEGDDEIELLLWNKEQAKEAIRCQKIHNSFVEYYQAKSKEAL
jgi:hypothetical protein